QQRGPEQQRHNLFERLVRVEAVDRGLAERKAETARDRRSEQEPAEEGDAVRARVPAPQHAQRRGERERAGRRDDREEQDMTTGVDHVMAAMRRILGPGWRA